MSGGRGTLASRPAPVSPTPRPPPPYSFTKHEPQGRKGEGEAAGAQDVGRKEERPVGNPRHGPPPGILERPQALTIRNPRVPSKRRLRSSPVRPPPLGCAHRAAGSRAPVLSRPAAAPCPSSGSAAARCFYRAPTDDRRASRASLSIVPSSRPAAAGKVDKSGPRERWLLLSRSRVPVDAAPPALESQPLRTLGNGGPPV